ncbi:MAG: pantoate--beta-alanine ligase [Ilumatobacteraceae bacterium]
MIVAHSPDEIRRWSREHVAQGRSVALVPTMGALHDGHLRLIETARRHADLVAVSIFVNPLQFERSDDFDHYPRPLADDLEACEKVRVDAVYAPTTDAMFRAGFDTSVVPGSLGEILEGAHRSGHFRGVATIVAKLLHAVEPAVAVFGEKDAQQLAVIRRMVDDLDIGVEIVGVATVREPDGLALSSRNRRLTAAQRRQAVCVPQALAAIRAAFDHGEQSVSRLVDEARRVIDAAPLARLEHLEIVDPLTFRSLDIVGPTGALVVTAVWFGEVRLIDNCQL